MYSKTNIILSGNYANDSTCAVSGTGKGEEFMRYLTAYDISARMEYGGQSLKAASFDTIWKKMSANSGGVIAVDRLGNCAMPFNSVGMFRGMCNSLGKCEVGIWEDMMPI